MTVPPDIVLEGGYLPVSAELIEKRLNEIWAQGAAGPDERRLVKLCLANVLIVADAPSRIEAENLAQQLATRHPSRVLLIVIDELLSTYSAFVRTACEFNADLDSFVCWEIVEILSHRQSVERIGGAVRSLLVDAVPVITVDFRSFQSTPEFDGDLHAMSDYYFVQADLVPATAKAHRMLPLGWYRTLVIRELLSSAFAFRLQCGQPLVPREIVIHYQPGRARHDALLAGWLVTRFANFDKLRVDGNSVRFEYQGNSISLQWQVSATPKDVLAIRFQDEFMLRVTSERDEQGTYVKASARFGATNLERRHDQVELSSYVLEATGIGTEFDEYAEVQRVIKVLPIP